MRSLRKGKVAVVALCGLATLANPVRAIGDDGTSATSAAPGDSSSGAEQAVGAERVVTGPVQLVDPATRTLHLKNSTKILRLDSDTQVIRDGHAASLADVNEGDEVRASCSGSGDDVSVSRLELTGAGAADEAGPAPSRGEDRSSARSDIVPRLAAPSASPSGQSGRQNGPVQLKQR